MKIPANGFTHAGKFHADDVFATALLMIVRPDIKQTRGSYFSYECHVYSLQILSY